MLGWLTNFRLNSNRNVAELLALIITVGMSTGLLKLSLLMIHFIDVGSFEPVIRVVEVPSMSASRPDDVTYVVEEVRPYLSGKRTRKVFLTWYVKKEEAKRQAIEYAAAARLHEDDPTEQRTTVWQK